MTRFIAPLLIYMLFVKACSEPHVPLTDHEVQAIDSLLVMDVPEGAPGLAIGIVRDGEIVYENYAGYATMEDSTLINPDTRFNIASNGKQFTALAILQLAEHNLLDTDEDIRTYLPGFLENINHKISIRHLLNHTSGIRDFYDLWSLQGKTWWELSADNQDVLGLLRQQQDLNFEPGSRYLYSNSNYVLLAEIIRNVSGNSVTAYTRELFEDLGMQHTSFESNYRQINGPIADPYFNFDSWTTYEWTSKIVGDGALFSTLPDQLTWEKIIQTKNSYPISADMIEKSQNPLPGSEITNYGYGLEFGEYEGEPYAFHFGSTGAMKSVVYRFPQQKISIVLLTNSGKVLPSYTIQRVSDLLLGSQNSNHTVATEPEHIGERVEIEEVLGVYQNNNGFTFRFSQRDGDLYLLRYGRNDTRLVRESANIFHQWNDPTFKQEFALNTDGFMQVTAYHTSHAPYTLQRIEADFSAFSFSSPEGTFINTETEVSLEINYIEGESYTVTISGQEYAGLLIKPTLMKAGPYTLQFIYEDNEPMKLLLDGDRIRNVSFLPK